MIPPRKPKLDSRTTDELRLYPTDDLRRRYQAAPGGEDPQIELRDGVTISRKQLRAVILHRVWWDRLGYFLLLLVSVIGAFAAAIAAIEGWR